MFGELWRNRRLIGAMAMRGVKTRYAGSLLGMAWAVLEPVLQFSLYLLVFGVFLRLRGLAGGGSSFALWLLAGLVPFLVLQEGWVRAAGVFRAQANLVKHIPVPCSALVAAELVAVMARHGVILALLLLVAAVMGQVSLAGLPVVAAGVGLTLILLVAGACWLSVAGAYLSDVAPMTATLMSFALYLTPVLYPETLVPEQLRVFVSLNPFWGPVVLLRRGLGLPVELSGIGASLGAALLFFAGGLWFFQARQALVRDLV